MHKKMTPPLRISHKFDDNKALSANHTHLGIHYSSDSYDGWIIIYKQFCLTHTKGAREEIIVGHERYLFHNTLTLSITTHPPLSSLYPPQREFELLQ